MVLFVHRIWLYSIFSDVYNIIDQCSSTKIKQIVFMCLDNCRIELWGGPLDQTNYDVSLNVDAKQGKIYQVADYWNGTGVQSGISSARVLGCAITMFGENGKRKCLLTPGEYEHNRFNSLCQTNAVTQYKVVKGKQLLSEL